MPRGGSPPQGLWMPPRTATLFVAASNSLDRCRAQADYICDGIADEVQINAALAALPASGGRVVLSEGTFVLADPISLPDDSVTLEGQGWGTYVNGNALATTEHAIRISGQSFCQVRNLSVSTSAGGGKTCHCIFLEDGANDFKIEGIYVVDSDSDAIHIEGTAINKGEITGCFIEGADGHGINITMDAGNLSTSIDIHDNHIYSAGISGIFFGQCAGHYYHNIHDNHIFSCADNGIDYGIVSIPVFGLMESSITDNYIYGCTFNGIRLRADSDNNLIENNFVSSCGGYGINIGDPTCGENRVINNKLIGNTSGAIVDLGVYTQLPTIFVPVPNPSTNIGTHPAEQLTDLLEVVSRFNLCVPSGFQELVTCQAIIVPGGTGNMRRSVATNWGEIASGEAYNAGSDSIAAGEVAVDVDQVEAIDIAAAFTAIAPGDMIGVAFTRHGDHANDTVGANCYLIGLRLRYV